jgi:hypothetical protein
MTLRTAIRIFLGLVLGLPLLQTLLAWVAALLRAMDDLPAAQVLGRINVGAGVLWLACLAGLVVCLGFKASLEPGYRQEARDDIDIPIE